MLTRNAVRRSLPFSLLLALATALLLVGAASAFASTSAQQVYETPEAGETPSPLPPLPTGPRTPAGTTGPTLPPVVERVAGAPEECVPGQTVGPNGEVCVPGSTVPEECVPGQAVGPNGEVCVPEAAEDDSDVASSVSNGPGEGTPQVSGSPPLQNVANAVEEGGTLPVTGLDILILLAAAAAAGSLGLALRRAAR